MTPDDPLPSRQQHRWQRLAASLRCKLARRLKDVAKMEPGDMEDFVDAMRGAMYMEREAALFDQRIERERRGWE